MNDLIEPEDASGGNAPEFTVTELSGAIKRVIESEFGNVRVRGEVGRVSRPRSGHIYLDLKDDRNVISGVIWKGQAARLATQPEEGLEVIATGRLTTFGGQSKYQIVIDDIRPAGVGALMAMLEKRKAALQVEGLFAPERKKPLPYLPEVIGVITSPSGAVIRDILHRLRDRFPRRVLIWPVAVQGERCAPEVVRAIEGFNRMMPGGTLPRPDLLIVARGGGSIEDLWGFNEETVARAAAASAIPLISAVGHETDITLIDYVADRRAPTPTAAAELAVPVRLDLLAWTEGQGARLSRCLSQGLGQRRQRLGDLSRALPRPASLVAAAVQRLDLWGERLPRALTAGAQRKRVRLSEVAGHLRPALLMRALRDRHQAIGRNADRLAPCHSRLLRSRTRDLDQFVARLSTAAPIRAVNARRDALQQLAARLRPAALRGDLDHATSSYDQMARRLTAAASAQAGGWRGRIEGLERLRQSLGYRETLRRGYAVVWSKGRVITQKAQAEQASGLEIEFADGRIVLNVPAKKTPGNTPPKPRQGSLF